VELLRQGEPPNFNDESGEKSALIGPRGWEIEHRSSVAAPHLMSPDGRAGGEPVADFLASLGGWLKVDSTGAEGKPSGTNEARSLRPSDEEPSFETQLSFIDGEIP
ncbi:hypothetical protein FOZ63_017459, partial [Perkinsus olseni]